MCNRGRQAVRYCIQLSLLLLILMGPGLGTEGNRKAGEGASEILLRACLTPWWKLEFVTLTTGQVVPPPRVANRRGQKLPTKRKASLMALHLPVQTGLGLLWVRKCVAPPWRPYTGET